jgi:hypothetical protein
VKNRRRVSNNAQHPINGNVLPGFAESLYPVVKMTRINARDLRQFLLAARSLLSKLI